MFSDVFHYITDTVCYMYMSKRLTSELTSLKSTSEPNLQSHRAQLKHFFPQITFSTFISSLRLVFSTSFHYRTFIRTRLLPATFLPSSNQFSSFERKSNKLEIYVFSSFSLRFYRKSDWNICWLTRLQTKDVKIFSICSILSPSTALSIFFQIQPSTSYQMFTTVVVVVWFSDWKLLRVFLHSTQHLLLLQFPSHILTYAVHIQTRLAKRLA